MDWITEIARDLVIRIDIDNPDSEKVVPGVYFVGWDGPLQVGLTGDKSKKEVETIFRPFNAAILEEGTSHTELESFRLVIDVLEGRAWVNSSYCRLSPIRDIRMRKD